jgi:hypothetical protein
MPVATAATDAVIIVEFWAIMAVIRERPGRMKSRRNRSRRKTGATASEARATGPGSWRSGRDSF